MTRSIPLALALLVPLAARAETPVRYVKIEEQGGKLAVPLTITKFQVVAETFTVIENGRPVTKTVNRSVPVTSTEMRPLTPEAGDYFTPTGERIDPKKVGDVLRKGAVLAIASEGKPLDPEVVKKNKELVAILVPKGEAAPKADPKVAADEKPFATEASLTDGKIAIVRDVIIHQAVTRQIARKGAGGKFETVTVTENVPVTQRATLTLDPKLTQVLSLDGKVVPPADWGALIKDKTKVIVSPGGKVVPDELRTAHKDAVAVVVLKAK
jgi:hypothetical protein